jgi:two-component system, OmpR family, alkaline phosphatase synthesis response regulator PhoP
MAKKGRILVVDDEQDIVTLLKYNLEKEGYEVVEAYDGLEAVQVAKNTRPDVILMDIMMPKLDGVEACRKIRETQGIKDTHIIFLTARAEEYSEIAAFEVGADDYIIKPIKPRSLISRISAYFRKGTKDHGMEETLSSGELKIDRASYTVKLKGNELTMPKKEFELLFFLASNPGKVYTRDELLKHIWGEDVFVLARTVDVHVRKVREKIGDGFIKTIKGVGYKFEQSE